MNQHDRDFSYSIDRRCFLVSMSLGALGVTTSRLLAGTAESGQSHTLDLETCGPEFSLCPFWFWNDNLSEREIAHQIDILMLLQTPVLSPPVECFQPGAFNHVEQVKL